LIEVDYELLPAVFDPLEAMAPTAPKLHDNVADYDGAPKKLLATDLHNGLTRLQWKKGDVERGFRDADLVLEHTFITPARHQGYLEPHAATVAIEADGRIQVWASVKNPFGVRSQLSKCLSIPEERIRMNPVNVGGEFGGKGDGVDLPVLYFLAQKAGRPVKIVMSYAEELSASNPAHPTVITIRTGVMRDGTIVARKMRAAHASGVMARSNPIARLPLGTMPVDSIESITRISSSCRFIPTRFQAVIIAAPVRWRRRSRSIVIPTSWQKSSAWTRPSFV
jgi:Aerobic-type carbon monoxide dehydrogenase, large subunit CoxL/CutL homologs